MKFDYLNDQLHLVDGPKKIPLSDFVHNQENPFYLYYLEDFTRRAALYKSVFRSQDRVHFAMKCNSHPRILEEARRLDLGVDLVSGGELRKALDAGFLPEHMIFSGVGKSTSDLRLALEKNLGQLNVESPQELSRIGEIASAMKAKARVAFRLNPDVQADTHPYIRTGFRDNKFGMDESFLPELLEILRRYEGHIDLVGITLHIGSQIRNVDSLVEAVEKSVIPFRYLRSLGFDLKTFDIGGGLGVDYENDAEDGEFQALKNLASRVRALLEPLNVRILSEPGRFLVARSGLLLTQVQYVKKTPFKNFVIVNTGMHHLMRPSLYRAFHRILPLKKDPHAARLLTDVVGPVCESSDVLGFDRYLEEPRSGDWLAVLDAGAYGAAMASDYNSFPRPEERFV